MSSKPLGLHSEALSQGKKIGGGGGKNGKKSFYLDISHRHVLLFSMHITFMIMSYM